MADVTPTLEEDIIIESRTQSPEQIQAALAGVGFETTESVLDSDQPDEEAVTPAPVAATAAPVVESDDDDEEETVPPAQAPEAGVKRPTGSSRLKQKLTERETEIAELKRQLAERSAPAQAAVVATPVATPVAAAAPAVVGDDATPLPRPDPDDFEEGKFGVEWDLALMDWRDAEKARVERLNKKQEQAQAEAEQERLAQQRRDAAQREQDERFNASFVKAREVHPDFDEVWKTKSGVTPLSTPMNFMMRQSDAGFGVLAYWLASNPDEAKRIFDATTVPDGATNAQIERAKAKAWNEIEKIEQQLQPAAAAPAPAQARTAGVAPRVSVPVKPLPPEPVGARSGVNRKRLSEMTDAEVNSLDTPEYLKLRKEEFGS